MKEQYLWPLVGVVLGWLLNAMSASAKDRLENKKTSARLLSKLIQIKSQVSIYRSTTKVMRLLFDNPEEYEALRIGLVERHFLKPDTLEHDFKLSIDNYSSLYPLSASKLESTYQAAIKLKTVNLKETSLDQEAYQQLYKTIEMNAESLEKSLELHIRECAFHHGIFTYLRVRFTKYTQVIKKPNPKDINQLKESVCSLNTVMENLDHAHNKQFKSDS
ncbi:hypothetical protein [Vibrio cholerae]|uniref:hypothetical protein n=1 Tax=Vibrio cholerae TaxID=666 RepID=UPI0018F07E4E|nr:hypothetical protein [Vibrio cholerae]MBJ6945396.1 hypothetical protein [Vibrio cholerae]